MDGSCNKIHGLIGCHGSWNKIHGLIGCAR